MSRCIDADALLDDVFERYCKECAKRKGSKNGKYRIICGIIYEAGDSPCRACDIDDMKAEIEDAPTIEPERKTGRWKKISPAGIYECSECGRNVMTADIEAYEFCHGCGAKMEEGDPE